MKMEHGLKTHLLKLNAITFTLILFLIAFIADAKTLKVDTVTPSVTDGDFTITPNGTGDIVIGSGTGFVRLTTGILSNQALIDLTADVTGILPIANGGTGTSSTTFVDLTTNVTGVLPVANGGTGSASQNFVDLTTTQTVAGAKTFSDATVFSSTAFITDLLTASSAVSFAEIATPSTPSSGIKVYAKSDNKLYQLKDDGTESELGAGGGGGSAGINFVSDDSFENSTLDPDTDGNGTESYQTYTTDAQLYSEFNLQYFRASYTGLTANDTYVRDTFARTSLDGKQGLFSVWLKADADNFSLCLRIDDSSFAGACDDALTVNVIGDDTWRKYEIPFVYGTTSVEYEIRNSSYTGAVDIELDKVYVGTTPDGYFQTAGQASFVGEIDLSNNCIYRYTGSTSYGKMTDIDSTCSATSTSGDVSLPTNTNEAGVKIVNARTDGYYRLEVQGLFYNGTNTGTCYFTSSTTTSYEGQGELWANLGTNGNRAVSHLTGNFKFNSSGDKEIYFIAKPSAGSGECELLAYSTNPSRISVHFYPDSSANIVTQSTELTAETANEFSAKIDSSATPTIISTNYDWIDTVTSGATGTYTVTFVSGVFNTAPALSGISDNDSEIRVSATSVTSSGATIYTRNTSGTLEYKDFSLKASKQGNDVNKSATVIGKFSNINSSELVVVRGAGNGGGGITAVTTDIDFTEVEDNKSAWNGDQFTAPNTSHYLIEGAIRITTSKTAPVRAYVDPLGVGSPAADLILSPENVGTRHKFSGIIKLNATDVLSIRFGDTDTLSNNTTDHWIHITELPDTESIIKNLNDNNNVECQTKILSADNTASGTVSDLTFNNLDTTRSYTLNGNLVLNTALAVTTSDGSLTIDYKENSTGGKSTYAMSTGAFAPSTSTLTVSKSSTATMFGSGAKDETYLTLCELPDNTILNSNKFD